MLEPEGDSKFKPLPERFMKNKYSHKIVKVIPNPAAEVLLTHADGLAALRCPVCGQGLSHVVGVYTLLGGTESDGLYYGSYLVARESGENRDGLAIRVRGECGHRWEVVFQQREGVTHVQINRMEDTPSDKDGFCRYFPHEGRS
jgi:hypothetical protein